MARSRPHVEGMRIAAVAALVVATLAAYARVPTHPFQFDAISLVLENPQIRSLSNLPAIAGLGPDGPELRNRWVRGVTYALEYALVGPRPALYHLDNVLLHAGVGLLVLVLVRRLSGSLGLAATAAGIFLLHPVNSDVVAQVAGRREILAALFALATLLLLERWVGQRDRAALLGALLCAWLAAFSKELGVLALPAFLLVDAYRAEAGAAGAESGATADRRDALRSALGRLGQRPGTYALLAATSLALTGLFLFATPQGVGLSGSPDPYAATGAPLDLVDRLRLAGLGLRLLAVPVGLSANYAYDALGLAEPGLGPAAALDLAVLAGGAALTAWGLWRRSWIGFGGAWYALFYLPHAGIIPWHEAFAERFLYLASIGFAVAAAAAARAAAGRLRLRPRTLVAAALLGATALGSATAARTRVWSGPEALWQSVVERYPRCARAHKGLGQVDLDAGRPEDALAHFRAALAILPSYTDARLGATAALLALDRPEEAARELAPALAAAAPTAAALGLEGMLHEARGDAAAAAARYRRAIERDPGFAPAYNNLARLRAMGGDLDGAVELLETALAHDPAFETALRNLAALLRHGLHDPERAGIYERRAEAVAAARGARP